MGGGSMILIMVSIVVLSVMTGVHTRMKEHIIAQTVEQRWRRKGGEYMRLIDADKMQEDIVSLLEDVYKRQAECHADDKRTGRMPAEI